MKRNIIIETHNGTFHADEVTAIALLKVFNKKTNFITSRIGHQVTEYSADLVIDISGKFDGVRYFDHHQRKGGKAAAGLIFDYLNISEYTNIAEMIKIIDANDVGELKSGKFELPAIIASFNTTSVYSHQQDLAFNDAVDFMVRFIKKLKFTHESIIESAKICAESSLFEDFDDVIELKKYTSQWSLSFNGQITPHINAVVWFDEGTQCYKAQVTAINDLSFDFNGPGFKPNPDMNFVHSGGFFAVAKDKKTLVSFLKESR